MTDEIKEKLKDYFKKKYNFDVVEFNSILDQNDRYRVSARVREINRDIKKLYSSVEHNKSLFISKEDYKKIIRNLNLDQLL